LYEEPSWVDELDDQVLRDELLPVRLVVASQDPDVAVGYIWILVGLRPAIPASAVDDADDLVAIEEPLRPHRRRDLPLVEVRLRPLAGALTERLLDHAIDAVDTGQSSAHRRQDLPALGLRCSPNTLGGTRTEIGNVVLLVQRRAQG
jgi:hypothetical protein